jgi:sec-independent protein translocase protein TatC
MNTFSGHLKALKNELIKGALLFVVISIALLIYSRQSLDYALSCGIKYGYTIMTQSPQEYFVEKLKFSFVGALIICIPFYMCMLIGFVSEEKFFKKLFIYISIFVLYGSGLLFAIKVMLPFCLQFLSKVSQETSHLLVNVSLTKYMGFIYMFNIALAIFAEFPILCGALASTGLITGELLKKNWRIALMVIGVTSMLITPPDPVSMILMMLPLIFIYGLCIVVMKYTSKRQKGKH